MKRLLFLFLLCLIAPVYAQDSGRFYVSENGQHTLMVDTETGATWQKQACGQSMWDKTTLYCWNPLYLNGKGNSPLYSPQSLPSMKIIVNPYVVKKTTVKHVATKSKGSNNL